MKKRLLSVLSLILSFSIFFCSVPVRASGFSNKTVSDNISFGIDFLFQLLSVSKGVVFSTDTAAAYNGMNELFKSNYDYMDSDSYDDYIKKRIKVDETTGDVTIDASANAVISNITKLYKEQIDKEHGYVYVRSFSPSEVCSSWFQDKTTYNQFVHSIKCMLDYKEYVIAFPSVTFTQQLTDSDHFLVCGLSSNTSFVSVSSYSVVPYVDWHSLSYEDFGEDIYLQKYSPIVVEAASKYKENYFFKSQEIFSRDVLKKEKNPVCTSPYIFTKSGVSIKAYKSLQDLKSDDCNERPYYIIDPDKYNNTGSGAQTISKGDIDNSISYSDCNNVVTNYINSNNTSDISDEQLASLLKALQKNKN